jgi:hypothetical protein
MCEFYMSSKGQQKRIVEMPYPYALNARDKLAREDTKGERRAELDALNTHIAALEAEQEVEGQVHG